MNIKNKMKLLFKSIFTQFGSVVSAEGQQIIWNEDGELAEGYEVYMEQEDENGELQYVPVPDGEYRVEDKVIVIAVNIMILIPIAAIWCENSIYPFRFAEKII